MSEPDARIPLPPRRSRWVLVGRGGPWLIVLAVLGLAVDERQRRRAAQNETRSALAEMRADQTATAAKVERVRVDLLRAHLADIGDRVAGDAGTDQDRCLRLAAWVAGHVGNSGYQPDTLGALATRTGMCNTRANLFVELAAQFGIPARVYNMYDFGGPAVGHSCAQAWYDGGWHFFDVTYAGAFVRDGRVLSWPEVRADPEAALAGMVVFPDTRDHTGAAVQPLPGGRFVPRDRMRRHYTPAAIREVDCHGVLHGPDVKWLEVRVAAPGPGGPVVLGAADGSGADVDAAGQAQGLGLYLGSLGTRVDTFHYRWRVAGGAAGARYAVRFEFARATHPGLAFRARPAGGPDRHLVTTDAMAGGGGSWDVELTAGPDGAAAVDIDYDFREPGRGLVVDRIEVRRRDP